MLVVLLTCGLLTTSAAQFAGTAGAAPSTTPDAFFGTWSDGMSIIAQNGQPVSQGRLDDIGAAGVGMVRQYVWWDRIETSPGVYDWRVMDQLMKDATERGIRILPTLLYTPDFYKPDNFNPRYITPPEDPQNLATFATKMVNRYGTHGTYGNCENLPVIGWTCDESFVPITLWEVWNEPDYPTWWKGAPDAAEYLALLKPTYGAIKAADPAAQVALGSLTNVGGGTSDGYLEKLYDLGAAAYFDVLTINPYARDVGALMAYVKGQRARATAHGDSATPTLVTEWGWATGGNQYTVTTPACQAALMYTAANELRRRSAPADLNLTGAIQFQWQDAMPAQSGGAWPHFAGVRSYAENNAQGEAKPARAALHAAITGQPAPPGASLESCPADQRSLDGDLKPMTITKAGAGSGLVKSSPSGINCASDCYQEWQPNSTIKLTATPDQGSQVQWRGVDCPDSICTVTMDQARDLEVVFSPITTGAPPGQHQETSSYITRTGTWTAASDARDRAGASIRASEGAAAVEMTFRGNSVRWISRRGPDNGKAKVFIDGVRVALVDLYSATRRYSVRVYATRELSAGSHTIKIQHTDRRHPKSRNDFTWIDAFIVR